MSQKVVIPARCAPPDPKSNLFNSSYKPYDMLDSQFPLHRAEGPGMTTRGFTLIELLVVVLIIGILSAVALPQYTASVEKSHAAEAVSMFRQVAVAERAYRLANGTYTRNVDGLDISLKHGGNFGYGVNNWQSRFFQFYVDGGVGPNMGLKGKAFLLKVNKSTASRFYAIYMTLDINGNLRLWCTGKYGPDYGMNGIVFNASAEASSLCKKISGNKNGLMLETQL